MLLFEFLNRISFFSVLTWGFFFIAVVCAITVTNFRSSRIRRYRSALITTATSALLLGLITGSLPYFMSRLSPDQSRLTPIDQLVSTEWIEPVSNPETEIVDEEVAFLGSLRYQFRYKLKPGYEFKRALTAGENTLVVLDQKGNVHGFNAYTGLNHWQIGLRIHQLLEVVTDQKRLYLLERTSLDALRISCLDTRNPALLWQRTLPRSKDGSIVLDPREQKLFVSAGASGVWTLKSKSGELLWKRPEIFSKIPAIPLDTRLLVFEPEVLSRPGHWHFLNPHTGATVRRVLHHSPDLEELWVLRNPEQLLVRADSQSLLLLNPADLTPLWNFRADSPIEKLALLGEKQFLLYRGQNLMELRTLPENELRWQKKIPLLPPAWIKPSPDLSFFAGPSASGVPEGGPKGVAFFETASGDYLTSGRESEPLVDLHYFGDWLYLMSEHYLWALKRVPK